MKNSFNVRSLLENKVKNMFVLLVLSSQRLWGRISVRLDGWSWENVFRTLKPPLLSLLMFTFDKKQFACAKIISLDVFKSRYYKWGAIFYSRFNTSLQNPAELKVVVFFFIFAVIWSFTQTFCSKTSKFKLNVVQLVVVKPFFTQRCLFVCLSVIWFKHLLCTSGYQW